MLRSWVFRGSNSVVRIRPPVVLKTCFDRDQADREVRVLRALEHADVAPRLLSYRPPMLRMAFAGTAVADALPGTTDEIRWLLERTLQCLAVVHAEGFVHNDVKPDNLLFDGRNLRLCDFGGATECSDDDWTDLCGKRPSTTRVYAAPEVWNCWYSGPKSDVFSLGRSAFAIATGELPCDSLVLEDPHLARFVAACVSDAYDDRPSVDEALQLLST